MSKQPTPTVKTAPEKPIASLVLRILGGLCVLAALLTGNLTIIVASVVPFVLFWAYAGHIQRLENIDTYLHDIREASNLQLNRLDVIARSLISGSDVQNASKLVPQILDVVSEARDLLASMQPDLPVSEENDQ